jgi:uncharacterized protein (TIGR02596 family)
MSSCWNCPSFACRRFFRRSAALDNSSPSACDGGVPRRSVHPPGFTVLEVVLALVIAAILICLSVAGYTRFIEATAIDGAAQMVNDVLTEARQDAVTQNKTVEVRLYAASGGNAYDALQLHWVDSDGTMPAAAPAVILPHAAVIDATPAHLTVATTHPDAPAADPADPRFNAQTLCFHFLPDGSTDLAAEGMVTVRAATQSNAEKFPANWACLQIDPLTGRTQVYRP